MLTMEAITERRNTRKVVEQVMFRVKALYGLSSQSVSLPLSTNDSIDSGQVCITIDPEGDPGANIGVIDYSNSKLKVRYAVQAVFPGLHDLVTSGKHDPSLLFPVRVVATDDCTLTENLSGWHALGCLDFLPGSLWAGATGGWDGRIVSGLGDNLDVLADGRSAAVLFDTTFLINWPEMLGGGCTSLDVTGSMLLVPFLETSS